MTNKAASVNFSAVNSVSTAAAASPASRDEPSNEGDPFDGQLDDDDEMERMVIRLRTPSTIFNHGTVIDQYSTTSVNENQGTFYFRWNTDPDLKDVPFKLTWIQCVSLKMTRRMFSFWKGLSKFKNSMVKKMCLSYMLGGIKRYKLANNDNIYNIRAKKKKLKLSLKNAHFTHWVTMVQVVTYLSSIAVFGVADYGFSVAETTGKVKMANFESQRRTFYEAQNPWIGPTEASLVLLGARYPPCMRSDLQLKEERDEHLARERASACCVLLNGEGCYQAVKADCDDTLSKHWLKWTVTKPSLDRRVSGSVCGQDPRYCAKPKSELPNEWEDDITKWAVCREPISISNESNLQVIDGHMTCRVQAWPCCLGLRGRCIITSWEHCDLMKGIIHNNARLCSQVNCFKDICGMHDFFKDHYPDQWYRLFTTLMIPEGLVTLAFSLWIQMYLMQDIEHAFGLKLVAALYLGCGAAANLAGAVLTPLTLKTGPSASQCAILAWVQGVTFWHRADLKDPRQVYIPMAVICVLIMGLGVLPWVDFWGNFFGFIFGYMFTAFRLRHAMQRLNKEDIRKEGKADRTIKFAAFLVWPAITAAYGLCFWLWPFKENVVFKAFDCIPINSRFCGQVDPENGLDGVANTSALGLTGSYFAFK